MNATTLSAEPPPSVSPLRQRAAEIIRAWLAWRARKVKLEHAVEVCAFVTLIMAWVVAYAILCPMVASGHHHANRHVAPAATFVVLR